MKVSAASGSDEKWQLADEEAIEMHISEREREITVEPLALPQPLQQPEPEPIEIRIPIELPIEQPVLVPA